MELILIWSKDQYIKTYKAEKIFITFSFIFRILLSAKEFIHIYNKITKLEFYCDHLIHLISPPLPVYSKAGKQQISNDK